MTRAIINCVDAVSAHYTEISLVVGNGLKEFLSPLLWRENATQLQEKKNNCKGTFAEVILLVYDRLYFHNTKLNTSNHSEELKVPNKNEQITTQDILKVPTYFSCYTFLSGLNCRAKSYSV